MRAAEQQGALKVKSLCDSLRCNGEKSAKVASQASWKSLGVEYRLEVLRRARHILAERALQLSDAISPLLSRNRADTLVSEVLPLLDSCKFLEKNAESLLRTRRLGKRGRPFWLAGVQAEIRREPFGHILVIGPSNFPLFLPGVQVLQALAAGNTVTWKPGNGGFAVAALFAQAMHEAGLPGGTLTITDERVESAQQAISSGVDKVVFTGSSTNGQNLLRILASTATPAVLELSGTDAIVVMPGADLSSVARAVAFGLGLNGGAVCMSPRRLFATPGTMKALRPLVVREIEHVRAVSLPANTAQRLKSMLDEAVRVGAQVIGEFDPTAQKPLLVDGASASLGIATSDIFAPVLSLIEVESMMHVPNSYEQSAFALTLSIFCSKREVERAVMLSSMMKAGTVLINDLIAPTADPRTPFGGRGASGYGVTRGAEGLLEMTAVKTLFIRRGGNMRHFDATTDKDATLFASLISASHGSSWSQRLRAVNNIVRSAWNRHSYEEGQE